MTPKEKAKELLDRYNHVVNGYVVIDNNTFEHLKNIGYDKAKQCALIAVDEAIEQWQIPWNKTEKISQWNREWWQEVKQEIEKL